MWLVPVLTAAAFFAVGCTAEKISTSETASAVTELVIPENSELPARYDAREDGRTASVKNQGDLGTCWAFASLLALESSLHGNMIIGANIMRANKYPANILRQF